MHFIIKFTQKKIEKKFLNNSLYIKLYKSGINVFKNNPWFGVGNQKITELKHVVLRKIQQIKIIIA